ncbi:glycoside hydrolase domain-containing protein, partial [bacterium]
MIDEPEPKEFPKINETGKYLHSIDPDLRFLMTHGYSKALEEAGIQIWCPVLMNTLDPTEIAHLEKEKKRGKEFWWYTCIGPKWHGMNYFTDELATAPRLHPWMNYLYGVTGILYWQTTNWNRVDHNPWTKTETYPSGNGDGHLIYP